ncbi:MAG: T9SS type A sorting domain-containing protein [Candidatus Zixiibacteriota bacterium]
MGNKIVLFVIVAVFILGASVYAVPDPGIADTAWVESVSIPSGSTDPFSVPIELYNDEELGGFGMPFIWDSPDITCDSVTFGGSRIDYVGNKPSEIDNVNQKFQVGAIIIFEAYLQPGTGNIFTVWFTPAPGAADQVITLDSTSYNESSPFILALTGGSTFVPQFKTGTITIGEPVSGPTIALDPVTLDFNAVQDGTPPPSQTFDISNTGAPTLNWTATADSWITLSSASGTGPATVTVDIDQTGLLAGTHNGTITVSDPAATNSPQEIAVTLVLDPPPPCLALSANEINFSGFDGDILNSAINVSNCGGPTLNFTITGKDEAWLTINPTSGTGNRTITFFANLTGLTPGNYSDVVTFNADFGTDNAPQDVTINLTVIDDTPAADTLWVSNVMATAGGQVVVELNYQNFVEIGNFNIPLWYNGTGLSCDSVSFSGSRIESWEEHLATIDNDANTVNIEGLRITQPYLATGNGLLAKMYFSIDPSAATQMVPIDSAFIPPAFEFLFIQSDASSRATEFFSGSIDITGLPCFTFPVDTVYFSAELGTTPPPQNFEITNSCYGNLAWSVTDDALWVALAPTSGMSGDFIEFSVNPAGLPEGVHIATATFASNSLVSPTEIPVLFDVYGMPDLALSTNSINFGNTCMGTIVTGDFDISNIGTGAMDWTAIEGTGVTLSATSGSAPATVSFEVNTAELSFGPQQTTITVNADASHSPQVLTLSFNIANCDECAIDIAEVNGPQGLAIGVPVYAYQIAGVAGVELHLTYLNAVLAADSVTSNYMVGATIGYLSDINGNGYIHFIWDNIGNPITVPDGGVLMTLWFTSVGNVGEISPIVWLDGNEIVDEFGNPNLSLGFCNGEVTIIDPLFDISGTVVYYGNDIPIEGVNVDLSGQASGSDITDGAGEYSFVDLEIGGYSITPWLDEDAPGVSVADVIKIRRHIAYVERFNLGYQLIAADVNLTNTVSVSDVISIRRYLAQLGALPGGNWTFIDGAYAITLTNWQLAPRSKNISIVNEDIVVPHFYGIRLGDVNATWSPLTAKPLFSTVEPVTIEIGEAFIHPNDIVTVPIYISDVENLAGIELHISFDGNEVQFTGVNSDILSGTTLNGTDNAFHLIWEDFEAPLNLIGSQAIAELSFRTTGEFGGSSEITISGAELADEAGFNYRLNIINGRLTKSGTTLPAQYSLEQNIPNPFNPETKIMASMRESGEYSLDIYNIMGQKIRTFHGYHEAGIIEFVWNGTDDNGMSVTSGIYLYKFSSGTFKQTKKMMLLK